MTRVSENSNIASIQFSVGKSKQQLEDLQIKGAHLKRISKPSDDPIGNVRVMNIKSELVDNVQYRKNASKSVTQLEFTEDALVDINNLLLKLKELAIQQSSDLYDIKTRQGVAKEVQQIKNQLLSISNRRLGNRYIFAGSKSLSKPFTYNGTYRGDENQMFLEISKDFFVPINLTGGEVFYKSNVNELKDDDPLKGFNKDDIFRQSNQVLKKESDEKIKAIEDSTPDKDRPSFGIDRRLASVDEESPLYHKNKWSIFHLVQTIENGLNTNNSDLIRDTLPDIDNFQDQVIQLRTKLGSISNSVRNSIGSLERSEISFEDEKSKLQDADVLKLYSDLSRQENALKASYKVSSNLMNLSLLNFLN